MAVPVEFSQDLVEEILVMLPVSSLLRFKCVSKQWFLLLSNPKFIRRHQLKTSVQTCQVFFEGNRFPPKFSLGTLKNKGDYMNLFQLVETTIEAPQSEVYWGFLGHCDGLLCLHFGSVETRRSSIVVWNPLTREEKRIQVPESCWSKFEEFGFGYDSSSDDYKVVVVTYCSSSPIKIHSLGLNKFSWKTTQGSIQDFSNCSSELSSVHVNGYLYWAIGFVRPGPKHIACFDLSRDIMTVVETLGGKSFEKSQMELTILGGSLCLVESEDSVKFDAIFTPLTWTAVDEDVIIPICYTKQGKVLIYATERQGLVLYNPNDGSFDKLAGSGASGYDNDRQITWIPVAPYVESLVSP
ncbi:hypothetical protein SLEP1_g38936 [Rubroshorea leprosula]|uniref:F-box domain-containing protein n=1 Tax=Rubroshorea leprosula TaxID=152421 RepID=A0AAV5KYL7_9ROSI|nr:hypothetical protein SLEP1_g38936 [Rubroshorea leprosula]